eukprot:10091-Rhodomonas_salina.2
MVVEGQRKERVRRGEPGSLDDWRLQFHIAYLPGLAVMRYPGGPGRWRIVVAYCVLSCQCCSISS